jgi:acetyl-CoA C-acetyltransferase
VTEVRRVALVGGACTRFGIRPVTWAELAQEAGRALFQAVPALTAEDVDSLFVGAAEPERFAFQSHVAPLAAEQMGLRPHRILQRTELACASGQSAIRSAYAAIAAGLSDVAVAVGVEKMNIPSMAEANTSMACVMDRPWDGAHGATAPPFFAMVAQRHMREYGTTEEQMALVSAKNHRFANTNPSAQFFEKTFPMEKLKRLPMIAPPLRLGDCSSMTDGAAAVVLVAEELAARYTDTPAWVRGTGQYSDFHNLANAGSLTDWVGLKHASREAYARAGIGPADLDVAEVHDCFSISEIVEYEALGLCGPGEGGRYVAEGRSARGGDLVVNPRGGLLGCGHPLGATGIAQAVEIYQQLAGKVPTDRRADDAQWGLVHNLSGSANVHSVMIYGKEAS